MNNAVRPGQKFYEAMYDAENKSVYFKEYTVLNVDLAGDYADLGNDGKIEMYCSILEDGTLDISSIARSKREAFCVFKSRVMTSSEHWAHSYAAALQQVEFAHNMTNNAIAILVAIDRVDEEKL